MFTKPEMAEIIPHSAQTLLETAGEFLSGGRIYRIQNPFTGRHVAIPQGDLPGIVELIPREMLSGEGSLQMFVEALLAARINQRTLSLFRQTGNGFSLPATAQDPFSGYYYPEKGEGAYFHAHGRIPVEPNLIRPIDTPTGSVLEMQRQTEKIHGQDPFTVLATIEHGILTFIVQAKRVNGRERIFAKLIQIGERPVVMTHWARLTGRDAAALIKKSGIDVRRLGRKIIP